MSPQAQNSDLVDWVESFTPGLYSWAVHKVSDNELARDLVQDTFMAAAEKLDSFKGDSSPKTYLYSILNHKIIDHYRKKAKQPVRMENQPISEFFSESGDWLEHKKPKEWHEEDSNPLDDPEFQSVLSGCLDDLPDNWNACVRLKYYMNKSGDEICQELDISPTNYWKMVQRAKLQLRECVEVNWFKV